MASRRCSMTCGREGRRVISGWLRSFWIGMRRRGMRRERGRLRFICINIYVCRCLTPGEPGLLKSEVRLQVKTLNTEVPGGFEIGQNWIPEVRSTHGDDGDGDSCGEEYRGEGSGEGG